MAPKHTPCRAGSRLVAWLGENNLTRVAFSRMLGVGWPQLWRWIVGDKVPHIRFAFRIEDLTGIDAREWIPEAEDGVRCSGEVAS